MEATLSPEPSLPYFRAESQSPSVLWVALTRCGVQIGTTKGTGGDVLILEEAAYCDEGFFYETVAPILSIGSASLVAISSLTSEINFYTRLIQMIDPATERPLFAIRCIELCCDRCKAEGKQIECVHMLHLVPMWQSEERHRKLKIMMQDRPDLIQSELAGLAFDSLQQVFRKSDIEIAMALKPLSMPDNPFVFIVIDPAAGGPQSDYAIVSIMHERGNLTVRYATLHASSHCVTNVTVSHFSALRNSGIMCVRRFMKKFTHLPCCDFTSLCMSACLKAVSMLSSRNKSARQLVNDICTMLWRSSHITARLVATLYSAQTRDRLCSQCSRRGSTLTGSISLSMSCGWHSIAALPAADCGLYVQVLGIDILMGCKGLLQARCFFAHFAVCAA